MAIRFLDAIDLTGLEMTNVLAENLPSNPTTALGEGQFIYDTTLQVLPPDTRLTDVPGALSCVFCVFFSFFQNIT